MDATLTHFESKKTFTHDRDLRIHEAALKAAGNFKRSEIELIERLEAVDQYKIHYKHGCNSLFSYAVKVLGLSEQVAGIFINVCRKTREVPELKAEIKKGTITVSKARRMTAVLNKENQSHWINLAKTSSKHQLDKQVAIASPKDAVREKLEYVHPTLEIEKVQIKKLGESARDVRVQLQLGVSEKLMLKLRRAQDLVSSQKKKSATLEETLEVMVDAFLGRQDPLEKAKRQKIRGKLSAITAPVKVVSEKSQCPGIVNVGSAKKQKNHRSPMKASLRHEVNLIHQSQCAFIDPNGKRCDQRRHLEVHHILPVSRGGTNEISNLILLCQGHHKVEHQYGPQTLA